MSDEKWATPREWAGIFALLVVIVCLLTGLGMIARADGAVPSNCRYVFSVAAYATADDTVDLGTLMATPDRFAVRRCYDAGVWIEHSSANTLEETRVLRNLVRESDYRERFGLPLLFCRTSFVTGYMMGPKWLFTSTTPRLTPTQKSHWRTFADQWIRTHEGCRPEGDHRA